MKPESPFACLVFHVPAPGRGRLLPVTSADLKASLGLRPMALAEGGRETDRPSLAILSDDDGLLARVGKLARSCGLTESYGAIAPPRPSQDAPGEGDH